MHLIRKSASYFLVLLLLASVVWAEEPTYKGRALGEWIADLRGLDQSARVQATIAIGQMGDAAAKAVPDLAHALTDPNVKVRANAAWALARMGDAAAPAIPDLTYALYDESEHVRGRATVTLGALGPKAKTAVAPLRDGLTEDHPGIRAASAAALWSVTGSSAESLPVLRDMLSSDDAEERTQAAQAAWRVGTPAAVLVPDLKKAMASDTPAVRAAVAAALGAVGQGDAGARKILEDALGSETDEAVLTAVKGSLATLGESAQAPSPDAPPRQDPPRGGPPDREGTGEGDRRPEIEVVQAEPRGGDQRTDDGSRTLPPDVRTGRRPDDERGETEPTGGERGDTAGVGLMDFGRPKPPSADTAPPPPPEPTHDGKTLTQWIGQLDSKDVGERREAAIALGALEGDGRCAIGPLNRLRLYDGHENVRHQAALALCRILGVSLGDILPKPPGGGGSGGGVPPIKGRMYYLNYVHNITPKGAEMRTDIEEKYGAHRRGLLGYANLKYVELAELQKYYQDAQARGLDINKPLERLLYDDRTLDPPKGTIGVDPRTDLKRRICKDYDKDHVTRITCNQQTIYQYDRVGPNGTGSTGGCDHYAMTAGKYDIEITIWTADGFRLDYKVPITVVLDLKDEEGEIISGPQDIAKEERQKLAALDPNDPDTRAQRSSLIGNIKHKLLLHIIYIGHSQPLVRADVLDYLREGFELVKQLHQIYPDGYSSMEEDLVSLTDACARTGSPDCLALAQKMTAYLDQHIAGIPDMKQRRGAYWYREVCYRYLADLTITAAMDISACRVLTQKGHEFDKQIIPLDGGKPDAMELSWYMDNAPQAGWWSSTMDEHRPADFSEIAGVYHGTGGRGKGEGGGEGDGTDAGKIPISPETMEALREAVERLDEMRAEEASFVVKNRENLGHANMLVRDALAKLILLRTGIAKNEKTRKHYEMLLKDEPAAMADESWSTEKLSLAMQGDARMDEDLAGPRKGGAEAMKAFWKRRVDDLVRKQAQLEKERDEIIDTAFLDYQNVIQSIESRGENYTEEATKTNAARILKGARENQARVKAFLLSVTDREADFREAARAVVAAGGKDEYDMRLLESSLMRQKGNMSVALRAARTAMKLRNEDARGVLKKDSKTKKSSWHQTPASRTVKELELQLLTKVYAKHAGEAALIKKLGYQALEDRGDPGVKGALDDLVFGSLRMASATGEDSVFVPTYEVLKTGAEAWMGAIKFTSGGWREIKTEDEAIVALCDFVDWVHESGTRIKNSAPKYWLGSEGIDEEDERGGKHVSQAREMGVVLDDASHTCVGILMISQLRSRDVSLAEIKSMSRADLKQKVAERFKGHKLSDARAKKLHAAIHFALQNRDVERLVEGKAQVLDAEAGRQYYSQSYESLQTTMSDVGESMVLPAALLWALPVARVSSIVPPRAPGLVGYVKWAGQWAHPTGEAAKTAITVKQWAAGVMGLPAVFHWASKHPLGRSLMVDYLQTTSKMSIVGRAGLDFIIQMNATQWAKHGVSAAVEAAGGSKATQEEAGRVAETITGIVTALGVGDVDVSRELAGRALMTRAHALAISAGVRSALADTDRMAALADANGRILRGVLPELDSPELLSPGSQRLTKQAADELAGRLESLSKSIPPTRQAHPLVDRYYSQLAALQESLQAAADGMPVQAKRFSQMAERLAERLGEGRASLVQQIETLESLTGSVGPKAAGRRHVQAVEPNWSAEELDFHKPSAVPAADRLYLQGKVKRAARLYEATFYLYDELGMAGDDAARVIAKRWQAAKQLQAAQDYYSSTQANADPNANALKPLTDAELARIKNAPDFQLVKVGTGISEPYWAMVGGKRVGVVKTPSLGLDAEIAGPRLAKHVGIRSPATARTMMPIEWKSQGTFGLYKGAGETASTAMGPGGDWRTIVTAKDVTLERVSPDGPAAYWVVQNGRKAGIFMPDWGAESVPQGTETALKQIAKESGGEILGSVPDTKMATPKVKPAFVRIEMTTPEVKCVFVRYVDGVDLGKLPEAQRILFRQKIARDWLLRLVLGDFDGHGLNFKVSPNGDVFSIDRNLADVLAENRITLLRVLGKTELSTDPVQLREDLTKLMKWHLDVMMGTDPMVQNNPLYHQLKRAHQHMTYEDFAKEVEAMQGWDEAFITRELGDAFGKRTAEAAKLIKARIDCLEPLLSDPKVFPALPGAPAPAAAVLPWLHRPAQEYALAA